MENMTIYEAGRSVPIEAQKAFSNGSFSGTDINPMWRIKKLTELFGPAGVGWYTEVLSERSETYGDTVMAIVDINLYIKVDGEWSKPIFGTGGNQLVQATKSGARPSDEGYKKAYTDALSIACKALGIGADIWFSKDPDVSDPTSKYADEYIRIGGTPAEAPPAGWVNEPPRPATMTVYSVNDLVCEDCGKPITEYKTKAGKTYSAEDVASMNFKSYGKRLCSKCGYKYKNGGAA